MANVKKGFKIVHLNIRSLSKHLDEVYLNLAGFDIIALTETWLHANIPNSMLHINDYNILRYDRVSIDASVKKRGGGIAVYVSDRYTDYVEPLTHLSNISPDMEQYWIEVKKPFCKPIWMCTCYRPPSGNTKIAFEELSKVISILDKKTYAAEILIMGDLNINYTSKTSSEFRALKEFERKHVLIQIINSPTRITNKVKSTIDLVLTDMSFISESGVLPVAISDHLPIYLIKKKTRPIKTFDLIKGRSYKRYNKDIFVNLIKTDGRWAEFWIPHLDPNKLWDIMLDIIRRAADVLCPFVNIRIRDNTPGWYTKEIIEEVNLKKQYAMELQKSSSVANYNNLVYSKRKVRRMLNIAKQDLIVTSLNENRNNPRRFWRIINEDLGLNSKKVSEKCSRLRISADTIIQGIEVGDYLSDYYANNGKTLAEEITQQRIPNLEKYPDVATGFDFFFIPMHVVEKMVKSINIHKSSGIQDINSELVRDAFSVLIVELTHLFNESITQNIFPSLWAIGCITPIPKGGDSLDSNNWRPITILPIPSKLLEKAIHYQLMNYFEENGYLHGRQHGFRKQHSTLTAIHRFLRNVYDAYDRGLNTSCIFVDYKKAFETLDHDILLNKLEMYGLSENSIAWMRSYLGNRRHTVRVNGEISKETTVSYGVPQGSILGPSLFIIYVNDLLYTMGDCPDVNIEMYADDTVLYMSAPCPKAAIDKTNLQLQNLYAWCTNNKLTINFKKTKHMMITRKEGAEQDALTPSIIIGTNRIENVLSYHYLGVDLDKGLTYDKILDGMYSKANRKLYLLKRIRPFITNTVANLVFKTHVLPMFDYADFLVESGKAEKIDRLDTIQKRALKIIDSKSNQGLDEKQLMNLYGLHTLAERRVKHHLVLMYRLSHEKDHIDTYRPPVSLRNSNKIKFKTRTTRLTTVLKSPYYRGVRLWDRLSEDTQKATTKVKFKMMIA